MASSEIKLKKLSNDEVLTTSHLRDIKAAIKEEMRMRSGNGSLFGYYEDIGGELKIDGYSINNLQKWTDYDGYFGHTDVNESFNGNIFPTQAQYQASLGYLQDSKLNSGSVQKGIRMADLKLYKLNVPEKEWMEAFTNTVRPLIDKIYLNYEMNDKLCKLRDALLPKLMNDEIDLDNIEI